MNIVHIAPFNTAGVPLTFVKAERAMGHYSRLITFGRSGQAREQDICLRLPLLDSGLVHAVKRVVTPRTRRIVTNRLQPGKRTLSIWKPGNPLEAFLFRMRESLWAKGINRFLESFDLDQFDIVQLDGGLGFFRDARIIRRLKCSGKKIICCYLGSDLRTRGIIEAIDRIADVNVTVEIDHLFIHPDIHHIPFPLDLNLFHPANGKEGRDLLIGHAPTNRRAKGSEEIIAVVKKLETRYPVRLVLIEGLPFHEAIETKRKCQIFIDQLGDLGYGMNGIEALALGIPTCTSLASGFTALYEDHPFLESTSESLENQLIHLIEDGSFRQKKAKDGIEWVRQVHEATSVVRRTHQLAGIC